MISLASIENVQLASVRTLPLLQPQDDKLSQILQVAEWYRWRDLPDGTREAWFILIKPIPGIAAGTVIRLSDLHERLFGAPLKKVSA